MPRILSQIRISCAARTQSILSTFTPTQSSEMRTIVMANVLPTPVAICVRRAPLMCNNILFVKNHTCEIVSEDCTCTTSDRFQAMCFTVSNFFPVDTAYSLAPHLISTCKTGFSYSRSHYYIHMIIIRSQSLAGTFYTFWIVPNVLA